MRPGQTAPEFRHGVGGVTTPCFASMRPGQTAPEFAVVRPFLAFRNEASMRPGQTAPEFVDPERSQETGMETLQ